MVSIKKNSSATEKTRIKILFFGFTIIFIIIFLRILYIEIFIKEKYFSGIKPTQAVMKERGTIYDRNGEVLAISNPVESLFTDPKEINKDDIKKTAKKLSKILDISEKELESKLSKKSRFVWIKRFLSEDEYNKVKELGIHGLFFRKEHKRFYPLGRRAAHILGIVGTDNRGLEGIELIFNDLLTGSNYNKENSFSGYDIYLTIDKFIQGIAESELKKAIKNHRAKEGVVIVGDPLTGEILALAVYPDFDPNEPNSVNSSHLRNRAVTDVFEAGSIMKIFSMSFAVENNLVKENEIFYCPGQINMAGHTIRCTHPHGKLNISGILEKSCNVGVIKISDRFDSKEFYKFLLGFGFGRPTGFKFPGEVSGVVHSPVLWSKLSKGEMSIGYEISVTPLQLVMASSAIANGGILYKPEIIKKIVSRKENSLYFVNTPKIKKTVISSNTAYKINKYLRNVVSEEGTAFSAKVDGFTVAGKTGTAKMIINGKYSEDKYIGSFIGWVPADDPILDILVVIKDSNKNGYYGGVVAAPVFSKIASQVLNYMRVYSNQDSFSDYSRESNSSGNSGIIVNNAEVNNDKNNTKNVMPNLKGLSLREVLNTMKDYSIKLIIKGSGKVKKQIPGSGTKIKKNQRVTIYLKYD